MAHLAVELKLFATLLRDGSTQDTPAVGEHEVHLLGSDGLGGDDEIALVFAVLIVDDNQKLALSEIFDSLVYCT